VGIAHTIILRWVQHYTAEFEKRLETVRSHVGGQSQETVDFHLRPTKITPDAYAASHRAVAELNDNGELPKCMPVRTRRYLNNLIEQDRRRVQQRLRR
jgi:transposase-like protein